MSTAGEPGASGVKVSSDLWRRLAEALARMRFGQVTLIVQDGRVIQMETTEKIRLPRPEPCPRSPP